MPDNRDNQDGRQMRGNDGDQRTRGEVEGDDAQAQPRRRRFRGNDGDRRQMRGNDGDQ